MVKYDENGQPIYACPVCGKRVQSQSLCSDHIDSLCKTHLWEGRGARAKTPTPSQKTKTPKTPSKGASKTPKKTPKKAPLVETSGNGNLNTFFKKSNPTPKLASSTPTPSASQGKRKRDTHASPQSSAPLSSQNNRDLERAMKESREMAEMEELQRRLNAQDALEDESEEEDAHAEIIAQRQRYAVEQVKFKKDQEFYMRQALERERVDEKARAEQAERERHQEAERKRLRLAEELRAEVEAKAKAEAKVVKAEAKAVAKAEKARLKAVAEAERTASASPTASQRGRVSETPVPPPSSQKRKRKDKSAPPSSSAPPSFAQSRIEVEEAQDPPPSTQSKKRKRKAPSSPSSTIPTHSQSGSGSESSALSPSKLSPSGSQSSVRKETRILPSSSALSPSSSQSTKASRSKSVPPSSNPQPSSSQNTAENERQEPPASTPIPTASQSKRARARAAKKAKKSTVLENSSLHSRDGQVQSGVMNPMIAPSPMSLRKKAAKPSRLSSVQSVDSSQGGELQASPVKQYSARPRRGSLLPVVDGRVIPIENHAKWSRHQIEWQEEIDAGTARQENEDEDDPEAFKRFMDEENRMEREGEDDEARKLRERAEAEDGQRQQDARDAAERARLEEEERIAVSEAKRRQRLQEREDERLQDVAHAELVAQGRALVKARKAEAKAKAKADADEAQAAFERENLQRQRDEEERQRQSRELAESKARAEEEERQRQRQQLDEEEESRLEAQAEADVQAESKAEAEAIALRNEELDRRVVPDTDDEDEDEQMHEGGYDEMYDAPEPDASQDTHMYDDGVNDSDNGREDSPEPATHGHVSEEFMQVKLPGPTTMTRLQQSNSSYSISTPYSSAPWSSVPESTAPTATASPTVIGGPPPSQDYDLYFGDSDWDGPIEPLSQPENNDTQVSTASVDPVSIDDRSQESNGSWQGIPDTPAPTTPATPSITEVVKRTRAADTILYRDPSTPTLKPFRPPMNPDAYTDPDSPTSSQKRRRVGEGWLPSDAIRRHRSVGFDPVPERAPRNTPEEKGVPPHLGILPLNYENMSPLTRRVEKSKAEARIRWVTWNRVKREEELDKHLKLRLHEERGYLEMERRLGRGLKTRKNVAGLMGMHDAQATEHVIGAAHAPGEKPVMETRAQLYKLQSGAVKVGEEDKDAPYLYAFRESILASNIPAASLYLAQMLKMHTEPRRICEVLCATAGRCVSASLGSERGFADGEGEGGNAYLAMASHVMNVCAFSDANDPLIQEQLLAATVKVAGARKTGVWRRGLEELFGALEGVGEEGVEIPEGLREGSGEDGARRGELERDREMMGLGGIEGTYLEDDERVMGMGERMKAYLPSGLEYLGESFMRGRGEERQMEE